MINSALNTLATAPNVDKDDAIHKVVQQQARFLPYILLWGLTLETLHACGKIPGPFDLPSFFEAVLYFEGGVMVLAGGGAMSLFLRRVKFVPPETSD